MRLIDAIGLKQAFAISAILDDNKTIEQIIDEQPAIEPKKGTWIDPISRKEALAKFEGSEEDLIPVKWARRYINEVPGLSVDLISREAVLNALDQLCNEVCIYSKPHRSVMCGSCSLGGAFDVIEGLPGAEERKEE